MMSRQHVTRRDFLKTGGALATAAVALYVITSMALGNAPKLKEIKRAGYGIDDRAVAAVAELPHVESLTVEDASVSAEGFTTLLGTASFAQRLRIITVARCASLDDTAFAALASAKNLRRLSLRDVPVTGSFLRSLPTLGQLEVLSLNQTYLTDEAWEALSACRNLKRLELAGNSLMPAAMQTISSLSNLQSLNLSDCGLTDELIEPLKRLPHLKDLILDGNPAVTRGTKSDN